MYDDCRALIVRPTWDVNLYEMAVTASKRSQDGQTKCGCVICDSDHCVLGIGYNGFPRDIDDSLLPNLRPEKYEFIIHAELNAIFNCSAKPTNGIAYITGKPCIPCLMNLWQWGVREVVTGSQASVMRDSDPKYEDRLRLFLLSCKNRLKIRALEEGAPPVYNELPVGENS